uniref:sensor histidine kinase n=1 Tax=Agathobacter sp. TaxID=2021311 RepID=UPI004055D3C5
MSNDKNYQFIIHEIKNDVALIQSSLQLMRKKHPDIHNYDEWIAIDTSLSDLATLFKNISVTKNLSQAKMNILNINDFLADFQTRVKQLCSCAEIPFIFEADTHSTFVSINASLLERALLNLVQNAIDAMRHCVSPTLFIHTFSENGQFCISITDTGIGMDNETLQLMYTPNYTTKSNGHGLGLCIVKETIKIHGGSISCESAPQKGTSFTIFLPIAD